MNQSVLKPVQLFAVVVTLFIIAHACNKSPMTPTENATTNEPASSAKFNAITDITSANPFNKSVGAPLDGRLGDRWIANYKKKYGYNKTYTLNHAYLQSIVAQPTCVGICLYYAKDGNNNTHILPIGIDVNRAKMHTALVSCSQGNISWATAQQWISKDLGTVDAHFFGSNTFDRLNQAPCSTIRVDFALNDENKAQLLLSNPCQVNLVKQYEDFSSPCPPVCPKP